MSDVRSLEAFRKRQRKQKASGNTLCRSGHHKWVVDRESVFDTKEGRLVTRYRCERCKKVKVKAE